jgi:hypothetical protein
MVTGYAREIGSIGAFFDGVRRDRNMENARDISAITYM